MGLSCYDEPHLGPPLIPSAQGLNCSLFPAQIMLWACLSLAPAVLQSCLAMGPVDLAGSWPVDSAPSLTLDLPCHHGLAWWSRECVWHATTVRPGLTLTWWFACQAWPWTYLVTTNFSGLQEASRLRGASCSLSEKGRSTSTIWPSLCPLCEEN